MSLCQRLVDSSGPRKSRVALAGFVGKGQMCGAARAIPSTLHRSLWKNWSPAEKNSLSVYRGHDRNAMTRRWSDRRVSHRKPSVGLRTHLVSSRDLLADASYQPRDRQSLSLGCSR